MNNAEKSGRLRQDVDAALADARGARQALLVLQERVNALTSEMAVLRSEYRSLSVARTAFVEHVRAAHAFASTGVLRRRRRRSSSLAARTRR